MKNRLFWVLVTSLALLLGVTTVVSAKSEDTSRAGFTEADQEYYMTEDLYFLINPGVDFELIDFEIPGDLQPMVTFSLKSPNGHPLDREGIDTVGAIDTRFMLTYIPMGEENKVSYHERFRDRGGVYTELEAGMYTYKFSTVLPADYQVDATHTLASTARRDLRAFSDFGLERYYDNDVYNFVPSGASEPMPRDITSTATCNRCHDPLAEHGGTYRQVQVCQQCHLPALVDDESGLSYSFNAVIHRVHSNNEPELNGEVHYPAILNDCEVCHTGGTPTAEFPLVANPNPASSCDSTGLGMTELSWGDEGKVEVRLDSADGKLFAMSGGAGSQATGNWVRDGDSFFLVDGDNGDELQEVEVNTTVFGCAGNAPGTFRGEASMLHSNWTTRPQRAVCGGCHANIDWETGEGHAGGAQSNDDNCSTCHPADSGNEFDASVRGAHTVEYKSTELDGVLVKIVNIEFTAPTNRPKVTFSLSDKNGPLNPNELGRLRFSLSGPNDDFDFYAQETATNDLVQDGANWVYRFDAKLPADAMGSYSLGVEGRINDVLLGNGEEVEDQIQNFIMPFAVTDMAPTARRQIVDDATCEDCHSNLSLHGSNRHDASGYCQTCHMPDATDEDVRLEGLDESIHFKYMIHKLHRGADLQNGYVVYGYRSSVHDYSDVEFPGDLRNCESCHEEDTYGLPLPDGVLPTTSPNTLLNPMMPITSACLSCHDSDSAAVHADSNSSSLGEACETCHGDGKTYGVERVHAR